MTIRARLAASPVSLSILVFDSAPLIPCGRGGLPGRIGEAGAVQGARRPERRGAPRQRRLEGLKGFLNQLKAVIVGAEAALRESSTGISNSALIRYCANLPDTAPTDVGTATTDTLRRRLIVPFGGHEGWRHS